MGGETASLVLVVLLGVFALGRYSSGPHDRHTETGYDRKVTLKTHAEATSTAKEEPDQGPSKHSSKHYSNNEALGNKPEASRVSSSSSNVDVVERSPRKSAVVAVGNSVDIDYGPQYETEEQSLRHLRIQTSHDTLVEGFAQWFGDGRENKPGEQSGLINSYNGNNQDWNFKSTEAALADWRGLVFAQGKGGLGNQMWSAAATISVARATNRLPMVSCNSCYRHEALRQLPCYAVNPTSKRGAGWLPEGTTKTEVGWGEVPDAPVQAVKQYHDAKEKVLKLNGWTQSFYSFADHWDTVCWALRPRLEVQKAAQQYFDEILQNNNVTVTAHTKVVVAHLRRGDYVGKKDIHGLLTKEYYAEGVKMIRSRVAKQDQQSASEGLVVVVMTEQENVEWCKQNMIFGRSEGVQRTICADARGKRCRGEIVDMFALSLGDYLIVANSTFSWWSHFFRYCRDNLQHWQLVSSSYAVRRERSKTAMQGISIFPYRWYTHDKRMKQARQKTFDLFTSTIMVPNPKKLFEDF